MISFKFSNVFREAWFKNVADRLLNMWSIELEFVVRNSLTKLQHGAHVCLSWTIHISFKRTAHKDDNNSYLCMISYDYMFKKQKSK